ncbi:MAG TPA: transglutaminase family protein [Caulobacteraceae bacterium]
MLLTVRHETRFRHEPAVRESVMELWIQPQQSVRQRLTKFFIELEPAAQLFSYTDFLGNAVYHFDIPQSHSRLAIQSTANVETTPPPHAPTTLGGGEWELIHGDQTADRYFDFLHPHGFARPTPRLDAFIARHDLGALQLSDPLTAMRRLSDALYAALSYKTGVTAVDSPIDHALEAGSGVCQDFAHVMIAIARSWGVPARYVSGYLFTDRSAGDRSDPDATHAWVEVFLPSLGWIGLDPTNNIAAGERHICVAIGRDYADAPPSRGVYKGEAASELTVAVSVREGSAEAVGSEFTRTVRPLISSTGQRLPSSAALDQLLQQQQ